MSKKLKYLIKMSLDKKFKSKWFLVVNIILCILLIGIINMDSLIKLFGGSFNEEASIIVIDNTNYVYDEFESYYSSSLSYMEDITSVKVIKSNKNAEEEKEDLKDNEDNILLIINEDDSNFLNAEVIVKSKIDSVVFQLISASLNSVKTNTALSYYGIDSEKLSLIEKPIEIEKSSLEDSDATEDNELLMGTIFPLVVLPFFMLTIFLVQMIGAEINEEKSTKSMEIIISNVSPTCHFTSKLLSSNIFVLSQGSLIIIYALIGGFIRFIVNKGNFLGDSDLISSITNSLSGVVIDNLGLVIITTLILMVITFILYSLLAGILASVTTNMEDFQQLQTPIVIISLVGYYLTLMAVMFEGSMFIKIASYIPFISALLSPALLLLGQIGIIDVIISIMLTLLMVFILYKYGLRIYKVGILNYSSSGLWKKMFRAIKEK